MNLIGNYERIRSMFAGAMQDAAEVDEIELPDPAKGLLLVDIAHSLSIIAGALLHLDPQPENKESDKPTIPTPEEIKKILQQPVDELGFSDRVRNRLRAMGIKTVVDLVQKADRELLRYTGFGRKSLTEVEHVVERIGLCLGMDCEQYI